MYFKACLEIKNRKNQVDEEIMFIQARDIVQAMDITKKKRGSRFKTIDPISHKDYMAGVDLKYNDRNNPPRA